MERETNHNIYGKKPLVVFTSSVSSAVQSHLTSSRNFGMNHLHPSEPVSVKYFHLHHFDKMGWVVNKRTPCIRCSVLFSCEILVKIPSSLHIIISLNLWNNVSAEAHVSVHRKSMSHIFAVHEHTSSTGASYRRDVAVNHALMPCQLLKNSARTETCCTIAWSRHPVAVQLWVNASCALHLIAVYLQGCR